MSLMKIPNTVLKNLICSTCDSYLSKAPIYIKPDGQNVCCECLLRPATRCKLYENIASLFTFPCRYYHYGCIFVFQFNKAGDHEENCPYRIFPCPVNKEACNWNGTASEVPYHYKNRHRENCLEEPIVEFEIVENFKINSFIRIGTSPFLWHVSYSAQLRMIWFKAVYLGEIGAEKYIRCAIKLSNRLDKSLSLNLRTSMPRTNLELCLEESNQIDLNSLFKFFDSTILQCRLEVTFLCGFDAIDRRVTTCSGCNLAMVPPIYRCNSGHLTCGDCKGYSDICIKCKQSSCEFSRALDVEDAAHLHQFSCRWNGCKVQLSCSKIKNHERECTRRIYTCPECKLMIGAFYKLHIHFKNHHKEITFKYLSSQSVSFVSKSVIAYVCAHKELFKVIITPDVSYTQSVIIVYYGPPSFESYYNYEIWNRYSALCHASKVCGNHYKVNKLPFSNNDMRSESCVTIKFNKRKDEELWIPFEGSSK